jgi:uncharacterized delta-60 repeat protein
MFLSLLHSWTGGKPHPPRGRPCRRARRAKAGRRLHLEELEGRELLSPGQLDRTFGPNQNGTVATNFGNNFAPTNNQAKALAIQGDGKVVVAGSGGFPLGPSGFALARYNSDGTLDANFGPSHNGRVAFDFGGSLIPPSAEADGVALQRSPVGGDEKIVAAGWGGDGPFDTNPKFALARLNANGTPDPLFGGPLVHAPLGEVLTPIGGVNDQAHSVAIQDDGKIVAAGSSVVNGQYYLAVVRYNFFGQMDTSFGTRGAVVTHFPGSTFDQAYSVAIQGDGKIVVAGVTGAVNPDFALVRFTTSGAPDQSFGNHGFVTTDFAHGTDIAYGVAIQPSDGKIVAAGKAAVIGGDAFSLARYNTDGTPDNSFGQGGRVLTDMGGQTNIAKGVVIQGDGKIVAAGSSGQGGFTRFALARYNPNGTLDNGFGSGGRTYASPEGGDGAEGVALQADGKIVAAGHAGTSDFGLARFLGDPPPTHFGVTPGRTH